MSKEIDFRTGDVASVTENLDPVDPAYMKLKMGTTVVVEAVTEESNVLRCRSNQNNEFGLVLKKYLFKRSDIKIATQSWFWGKISREKAQELLVDSYSGSFLVRESDRSENQVLSVKSPSGEVKHFLMKGTKNGRYVLGEAPEFDTVIDVVEFHRVSEGNLGYKLTYPIDRDQNSAFNHDSLIETLKKAGWWASYESLIIGSKLGSGQFGEVFHVTQGNVNKAAKILKSTENNSNAFLVEAIVMSQINHPNLVELSGVSIHQGKLIILMELYKKGTLYKYLTCQGRHVITHKELIRLSTEICSGMSYLESKNIIHRDLSTRNVLLTDTLSAKITDFGLAMMRSDKVGTQCLPIRWTAPEALKSKIFSTKSDVWSFGVLLWECFSYGKLPYSHCPNEELEKNVINGDQLIIPDDCPFLVHPIMSSCWNLNPDLRPSFSNLLITLKNTEIK